MKKILISIIILYGGIIYNCKNSDKSSQEMQISLSMTIDNENLDRDTSNLVNLNVTNLCDQNVSISLNSFKIQLTSSLTGVTQVYGLGFTNIDTENISNIIVKSKGTFSLKSDLNEIITRFENTKKEPIPLGNYSIRIILDDMDVCPEGSINSNSIYIEI